MFLSVCKLISEVSEFIRKRFNVFRHIWNLINCLIFGHCINKMVKRQMKNRKGNSFKIGVYRKPVKKRGFVIPADPKREKPFWKCTKMPAKIGNISEISKGIEEDNRKTEYGS